MNDNELVRELKTSYESIRELEETVKTMKEKHTTQLRKLCLRVLTIKTRVAVLLEENMYRYKEEDEKHLLLKEQIHELTKEKIGLLEKIKTIQEIITQ